MKQIAIIITISAFFIYFLIRLIKPKIFEHAIQFEPPHLTNNKDKERYTDTLQSSTINCYLEVAPNTT